MKTAETLCGAGWYREAYRRMALIRGFETKAAECFTRSELAGNIHLYMGQEASGVGACLALKESDYITSTHRGHGHCLAKGASTDRSMAELFGKETGYCRGRGGSMHIVDVNRGILGANGIVGAGIPLAAGSALVSKIKGDGAVTMAFFGDGASNQGTFHETMNMAAAWKLPMVFLLENNHYGTDVEAVFHTVAGAVERARSGDGPSLIETMVYRYQGHYCGDPAAYRPKEYLEEGKSKDPIDKARARLLELGVQHAEIEAIDRSVAAEIEGAYQFAKNSPDPDPKAVIEDVYSSDNERSVLR